MGFRAGLIWLTCFQFCLPIHPGAAREPETRSVSPLTFDEDGLPVLKVKLHPLHKGAAPATLTFILDTGASMTILDVSVPSSCFRESRSNALIEDAVGARRHLGGVVIKRMEVDGILRDGVPAVRMDLKSGMVGKGQDEPVDGVLGMNFLDGTRFLFDAKGGRVEWWPGPLPEGLTLPLIYSPDKRPGVMVRFGKEAVPCLLDTGGMGGLDLPWHLLPHAGGTALHTQGALGESPSAGLLVEDQRVELGSTAWNHLPVYFQQGIEEASLGQDAWSTVPVCFDFRRHTVTWVTTPGGDGPIKRPPSVSLPILWDRSGKTPVLKVVEVMPGSAMERAGCKAEDEILRAGPLEGKALTRRSLLALMAKGEPHGWTVRRGNALVQLELNPPK